MYARFATRTLRLIAGHDRKDNADILWQTFAFGNVRQQGLQGRRIYCGVPGILHEPYPATLNGIRSHEITDGIEDDPKLAIVLQLKLFQFRSQPGIGGQHLAQPDECAHDLDVDLDGPLTVQN